MPKGVVINGKLKQPGTRTEYTSEQVVEITKCMQDPEYFINNYIKIVNVDHGLVPFKMYDFQKKIVKTIHENRFSICKIPRQSGKCVHINTLVKVRNKQTGEVIELTMGELYERCKANQNNQTSNTKEV